MQEYAMKAIKKAMVIEENMLQSVLDEIEIMKKALHPFLAQLVSAFETDYRIFLVMPLAKGGDMFGHLTH
jgi:serine/threonine protein kinase